MHSLTKSTGKLLAVIFLIAGLLGAGSVAWAQQGKYVRKSISSVESVWVKPGAIDFDVRFNYDFFDLMVDEYIETNRFDYNKLPDTLLYEFRKKANELNTVNPETMKEVLEETVVKEVLNILNDPEIKKQRGTALKSEADLQTFAATKAKSLSLTTEELKTLMNSAYIYLPYVNEVTDDVSRANAAALMAQLTETADEDDMVQVAINGGIIWYQLQVAPDGSTELELIKNTKTSAYGTAEKDKSRYNTFRYGPKTFETSPKEYAFFDATQAWAKNLGVQTKEIKAFKLSAQVTEVVDKTYSLPLSREDGVHLDDTFFLVQNVQTNDGEVKEKKVGFVRLTELANREKNPSSYSKATQLLGDKAPVGTIVRENPRYGMNMNIRFSSINGINVTRFHAIAENSFLLEEDADAGYGVNLDFAYNLAPITGASQTFLNLDLSFHALNATLTDDAEALPYLGSAYLGFKKKFWFGRSFLGLGLSAGYDRFGMTGTYLDEDYTLGINAVGGKADARLGFLLSPNWSLHVGAGYKVSSEPLSVTVEWGDWDSSGLAGDYYSDMELGGLVVNAGLTYSLRQLPFNILGFLDGFKKY